MTITTEEIERLRDLAAKATPRLWNFDDKLGFIAAADWTIVAQTWDKHEGNFKNWRNNAAYIVAAANALPALLDKIEALTATRAALNHEERLG